MAVHNSPVLSVLHVVMMCWWHFFSSELLYMLQKMLQVHSSFNFVIANISKIVDSR